MARLISWIAMVVVGILVVLFAVSNRSTVMLDLWPLPSFVPVPFYGSVLSAAFMGFMGGAIVAWFSAGGARRKARHTSRKVSGLETDLDKLNEKIEILEASRKSSLVRVGKKPKGTLKQDCRSRAGI